MKTIFLFFSILSVSTAYSNQCSEKEILRSYCATIDWAGESESDECPIRIDGIVDLGNYKKNKQLEFYSTPVSFPENGWLYEIQGNYMGGTGIDVVLVDPKKCQVIDQTNVYSE